ncbi:nucleoside hydrolase [Secundilactobacillus silagei]|uniref:Inosine-uridine preferring nucleoside hydrolase n=1 Tax=Secundilactobacillus silagei JCM 19001 TaxID=1302250 RepID=A0A1Z5IHX9_9LACO|nr:nucleoside hydrolase [Secundilactobacillus silagei]TDG67363.1 hypothetical protein C5L25_000959 [Secundilactobacillus silagei JCM 19001]GAX01306.1 inosine-uridine preferring nucleoside hydrolase [Secundilactobacillus silagei JCM 19001]
MLTNKEIEARLLPPTGKIKVVLDTDAFNEVDDQFEITWALTRTDRLDIQAIYAAPFYNGRVSSPKEGMQRSYKEIFTLLEKAGVPKDKYPVFHGSTDYLPSDNTPVASDAADDLIKRAMSMGDEPLYVVATGAITTVASALLKEPKIADKIVILWLGGQPLDWSTAFEFNLSQDKLAVKDILQTQVPFILIPCMSVASELVTTNYELDHYLEGTSKSGEYLRKVVSDFINNVNKENGDGGIATLTTETGDPYLRDLSDYDESKYANEPSAVAKSKIIWDISTVAFLVNPLWTKSSLVSAPILTDDETWQATTDQHPIRVVRHLDRDAIFGDLFTRIKALP